MNIKGTELLSRCEIDNSSCQDENVWRDQIANELGILINNPKMSYQQMYINLMGTNIKRVPLIDEDTNRTLSYIWIGKKDHFREVAERAVNLFLTVTNKPLSLAQYYLVSIWYGWLSIYRLREGHETYVGHMIINGLLDDIRSIVIKYDPKIIEQTYLTYL